MSIKAMTIVWEHSHYDGSTLLTLLALSDMADDFGVCWPSVEKLAKKTRQSERNVQRCLAIIDKDGFLDRTFRRDKSSLYQLRLIAIGGDKMSPREASQATVGGDSPVTRGVTNGADGVTHRDLKLPDLSPKSSGTVNRTVIESRESASPPPLTLTPKPDKDTRHQDTLDYFFKAFCEVNDVQDVPNMKAFAANLKSFLRDHPARSYPQHRINVCIDNWAASHPRWHTHEKPWSIILHLDKYSKGALDEYATQIGIRSNGKPEGAADKRTARNKEKYEQVANSIKQGKPSTKNPRLVDSDGGSDVG